MAVVFLNAYGAVGKPTAILNSLAGTHSQEKHSAKRCVVAFESLCCFLIQFLVPKRHNSVIIKTIVIFFLVLFFIIPL